MHWMLSLWTVASVITLLGIWVGAKFPNTVKEAISFIITGTGLVVGLPAGVFLAYKAVYSVISLF